MQNLIKAKNITKKDEITSLSIISRIISILNSNYGTKYDFNCMLEKVKILTLLYEIGIIDYVHVQIK